MSVIALVLSVPFIVCFGYMVLAHAWYARYLKTLGDRPAHRSWDLLRYWFDEVRAMFYITLWHVLPNPPNPPIERGDAAVLLVHGYTQDRTNFYRLRRRTHQELNVATRAVSLGVFRRTLEDYAPSLERALDELVAEGAGRIAVVCHSMGGLIVRIVLARREDLRAHIDLVMTVGTPHRGTASTRYLGFYEGLRQMSYPSAHLAALPHLAALLPADQLVTMAAAQDYVVYPESTSTHDGVRHLVSARAGHAGLLVHDESLDQVLAELATFAAA